MKLNLVLYTTIKGTDQMEWNKELLSQGPAFVVIFKSLYAVCTSVVICTLSTNTWLVLTQQDGNSTIAETAFSVPMQQPDWLISEHVNCLAEEFVIWVTVKLS